MTDSHEEIYDILDAPEVVKAEGWVPPPSVTTSTPCPNCGYDLQGTAGFRCPECGVEYDEAAEVQARNASDWYDFWVLRWTFIGVLPMIAWCIIGVPVTLIASGVFSVLFVVFGLFVGILSGLWAAKKVTEEMDLANGLMMAFVVGFCTIGLNLGIWRGVVGF